jgi:hypothetical protein
MSMIKIAFRPSALRPRIGGEVQLKVDHGLPQGAASSPPLWPSAIRPRPGVPDRHWPTHKGPALHRNGVPIWIACSNFCLNKPGRSVRPCPCLGRLAVKAGAGLYGPQAGVGAGWQRLRAGWMAHPAPTTTIAVFAGVMTAPPGRARGLGGRTCTPCSRWSQPTPRKLLFCPLLFASFSP